MGIFDFFATVIYLVSMFVFQYFIRPLVKKAGKMTEWSKKVIPVFCSVVVGSIGFWLIQTFSGTTVTIGMIMWYLFLTMVSTKIFEKSEIIWKLLGEKFKWIEKSRPGENPEK